MQALARCQAQAAGTGPGMVHSLPPLPVAATYTPWQSLYGAGPMFANELLRDAISRPSFSKLSDCHALGLGAAVIVLGSIRPGEPRCGCRKGRSSRPPSSDASLAAGSPTKGCAGGSNDLGSKDASRLPCGNTPFAVMSAAFCLAAKLRWATVARQSPNAT